jgi:hypothetical protein
MRIKSVQYNLSRVDGATWVNIEFKIRNKATSATRRRMMETLCPTESSLLNILEIFVRSIEK